MNPVTIEVVEAPVVIEVDDGTGLTVIETGGTTLELVLAGSIVINQSGGAALVHEQLSASASWIITHGLGRLPSVTVYLMDGELVEADVNATTTQVNIVFPTATAGRAVIN